MSRSVVPGGGRRCPSRQVGRWHADGAGSPPSEPISWKLRSSEKPKLQTRAVDALSRRSRTRSVGTSRYGPLVPLTRIWSPRCPVRLNSPWPSSSCPLSAGAFDSLGHTRRGLIERHEQAIDAVVGVKRKEAEGQFDLSKVDCSIAALTGDERNDGAVVTVGGIISGLQRKVTKQGNQWAIATIEDLEGAIETMFFPATYQLYGMQLAEDAVVVVKGRLDKREDVPRLVAMELTIPDISDPVVITVPTTRINPPLVDRPKEILAAHAGPTEVHLRLHSPAKTVIMRIDDKLRVTPSPAAHGRPQSSPRPVLPFLARVSCAGGSGRRSRRSGNHRRASGRGA
jgi:OB-fold nucleic acid binding domain